MWLRKDEKENAVKGDRCSVTLWRNFWWRIHFRDSPLSRKFSFMLFSWKHTALKAVFVLFVKYYRPAMARESLWYAFISPREGSIKSGSTQKCNTAELFRVFFQSSGPRERWAGGTSWRKTRSKTHPSLVFKKPEMAQSAREEPGGNA